MHPCTRLHTWFDLQSHLFTHKSPYILSGHRSEQLSPNIPFGHSIMKKDLIYKSGFYILRLLKYVLINTKHFDYTCVKVSNLSVRNMFLIDNEA